MSETKPESGSGTPTSQNQDLFTVLGGMLKECSTRWNQDANENLEIVSRDLQNLYTQFGSLVYQKSNMLNLSAEEIRAKTVEELYSQIKFGVLSCRNNCQYVHTTTCQSERIMSELDKRLSEEGFSVSRVKGENKTVITVSW
jgi:hypothetical protein